MAARMGDRSEVDRKVTESPQTEAEQAALRRVATLVAHDVPASELFRAVAREVGAVLGTDFSALVRFEDHAAVIVASSNESTLPAGTRWDIDELPATAEVYRTGRSTRVDGIDWSSVSESVAEASRLLGVVSTVASPIVVAGSPWGALSVSSTDEPLPLDTEERLERFTELVATAIANADSREALGRLAEEQAALRRVATLVARDVPSTDVFESVATEVGKLLGTDITVVGRYDGDGAATAIGSWSASGGGVPVGTRSVLGGHNVLSIVAETGQPARVDGYAEATGEAADIARLYGWHSSIAAPIVVEGRVWGVMLVATQRPEPFPDGAEGRLAAFTDLVATAVGNAQAHDELRRFGEEQATLRRIATLVAKGVQPQEAFAAVTEEVAATFRAITAVLRFEDEPLGVVLVGASNEIEEIGIPIGARWAIGDALAADEVYRTGRSARVGRADWSSVGGPIGEAVRRLGIVSTVASPILVEGSLWGVITVNGREELSPDTEQRLEKFTDLVTTAIANAEGKSELAASRRRIVAASDETRRRIERDLHDGIQQRLVSLGLAIRAEEASLPRDQAELRGKLSGVAEGMADLLEDLQEISRGIHPAILSKGGLGPALGTLAHRSSIPVNLDVSAEERLPEPIEVAAYFVASEALANATKHSQATRIDVSLTQRGGRLLLSVRDDGVGGADSARGSGLVGLTDRVEALGGSISVTSRPGEGTEIIAELPVELDGLTPDQAMGLDASSGTLVGRERELSALHALADGIRDRGGSLLIRGEAGIGKSALLAAVSARASEHGGAVMTTVAAESEAHLPFAGLHRLLRPYIGRLNELPHPQRRALETAFGLIAGEAPDLFLIGLATLGCIGDEATARPMIAVVDDAQWLDVPSAQVLTFVARRLETEPVLLLLAVRDGVPNAFDDAGLPEFRLSGLDEEAAAVLLDRHGSGLSPDLKARVLREAAGNPLALTELPASAAGLGADRVLSAESPLPLTARLEQAFAAKLTALDATARTLMLLAALDEGKRVELDQAAHILIGTDVSLDNWMDAVSAGLGVVGVDGFRFRHPLIRSAVYQEAGSEERRRAHAALADVLAGDPDRAVWHLAAATTEPDENVASALVAAAERARLRGGGDVAIAALERGGNLTPDPRTRALRLWRAADLGWELGRWQDSARLFREAQRLGLPAFENAVASFSMEAFEGTMSSSISTIRAFAEVARDLFAAGERRKALEALAAVSVRAYWGNLDQDTQREVSAVAKKFVPLDDPQRLCFLAHVDPIRNGREVVEQLRQISPSSIGGSFEIQHVGMAAAAVWADDLAVPLLRAAANGLRAEGRFTLLASALAFEAWANLHRGALRPAMTAAAEAVRMAEETGQALYVPAAKLALAVALSQRGDDGAAQDLIAEAEAALVQVGATPLLALVALARSRAELAAGRFADAYQHLARLFDPADVAFQPFLRGAALADLVDAAIGGDGDLDLVGRHLAEWQQIAFETKAPYLEVQLSYTAAVLAEDEAAEHLLQDAMTSGAAGWEFYAARSRLAYGVWLRRHRRSADARAPLREAARTFDALGQEMFAARALSELRASGEIARPRVPEAWAQLTPQELQIAQLAADGLSNREIGERLYVSHRTVGTHLYHMFPKLGITSRAQLRDVLEPAGSS